MKIKSIIRQTILCACILFPALCLLGYVFRGEQLANAVIEKLVDRVLPPEGRPSAADQALAAIDQLRLPISKRGMLWGVDQPTGINPTPTVEQAREDVARRTELRDVVLASLEPELEVSGTGAILQLRGDGYHAFRDRMTHLAEDVMSLFVAGRDREALSVLEAAHRMARIAGRGTAGQPTLLAKMVAVAGARTLDRAVTCLLERHLVPAGSLAELEAIYQRADGRELDLGPAMEGQFDLMARAVQEFDRSLGLSRIPMRLVFPGDGATQIRSLREDWRAGRPIPHRTKLEVSHFVVANMLDDVELAKQRYAAAVAIRHELRAAIRRAAALAS